MMGGGDATPAPNTATKKDDEHEDYAAAQVGRPCCLGSIHLSVPFCTPPLLVKFDVHNITFDM
jgi:hypothetical protein